MLSRTLIAHTLESIKGALLNALEKTGSTSPGPSGTRVILEIDVVLAGGRIEAICRIRCEPPDVM
jgi:hypothetical protein